MLRFHNRVVDFLPTQRGSRHLLRDPGKLFAEAQRQARWHYQWIVLNDFLPTIAGQEIVNRLLPHLERGTNIFEDAPQLKFFRWKKEPFMPIEFSAAAYRFGHSMVRPIYRLNTTLPVRQEIFFTDLNKSLTGFRAFPSTWAVDWSLFFAMMDKPPLTGINRLQKA